MIQKIIGVLIQIGDCILIETKLVDITTIINFIANKNLI